MERQNLLGGPPATYLPADEEADAALRAGEAPEEVAARFPTYSAAWAALAAAAFARGDAVTAYAYARTGYHRGLDQLRRAGWHGHGPIPWEHEPNRGFLRSLHMLAASAAAIGEDDEAVRCEQFLRDSSPTAAAELGVAELGAAELADAGPTARRRSADRPPDAAPTARPSRCRAHNRSGFPALAGRSRLVTCRFCG